MPSTANTGTCDCGGTGYVTVTIHNTQTNQWITYQETCPCGVAYGS